MYIALSISAPGLPENWWNGLINGKGSVYSHTLSSLLSRIFDLEGLNTHPNVSEIDVASYYDIYLKEIFQVFSIYNLDNLQGKKI